MKKYNLSKIMKRAWELVKKAGMTISSGLKKAWDEAKETKKEFKGFLKMQTSDGYDVTVKMWQKADKKRIYFNDYKRRNVGYIDCMTGETVTYDGFAKMYIPTIEAFKEQYAF